MTQSRTASLERLNPHIRGHILEPSREPDRARDRLAAA
jgi:hypothetical protein